MEEQRASWKTFYVIEAGRTNGAHHEFVEKLKSNGLTEVTSPEECDYLLVFCPVVSRVGTDIGEALEKIPPGKPVILVVMHHAFDPSHFVSESRKQVNNPNVHLTVDCLFFDGKLLHCNLNDIMWGDIGKLFGVSISQEPSTNTGAILSSKTFYVIEAGRTNGAHHEFVEKLKSNVLTEVTSPEQCDYLLVFCPVVSRVGADIGEALEEIPPGKPVILVVMHHTFDPNHFVSESRKQVNNPNVHLTVDCLFFDGKLLHCNLNDIMWGDIGKLFGVSISQEPSTNTGAICSPLLLCLCGTKDKGCDSTKKIAKNGSQASQPQLEVSSKTFYVIEAGRTNGAHHEFVEKLKSNVLTEVTSPEQCDYLLVFCPVVSRVGTDIGEALEEIPPGKPVILVVMHHTFDPSHVVSESRKQVNNPNVHLTVDCLFYDGKLLQCYLNDIMWGDIGKLFGVSISQEPLNNTGVILLSKTFYVIEAGRTNGAHREFVEKLKSNGLTEVTSPEQCDHLLVFCPVVSRVGTDIGEALEEIPPGKPVILVVMHHTFDPSHVVSESRKQVNNPNVHLTVDCLFYDGKLLQCYLNDIMWGDIGKLFGVSISQEPSNNTGVILSSKTFYVIEAGRTNGAHREFVEKLKSNGLTEVTSPEQCDHLLVFCPVVSRVGTDIGEALEEIPPGKPVILVVMHHTFDPNHVVSESRKQVNNSNVHLTVDCLFYDGKLLHCNLNDIMWGDIGRLFGVSTSQEPSNNTGVILSSKTFYVIEAGRTNGAHREFVEKLKSNGLTEGTSPEQCDYLLVFCPVVTKVGVDIREALEKIPPGKPVILVVMHHTFNPSHVVSESRKQVNSSNVRLTVDCLFYDGKLLQCNLNDIMWGDIGKLFGVSISQGGTVMRLFYQISGFFFPKIIKTNHKNCQDGH